MTSFNVRLVSERKLRYKSSHVSLPEMEEPDQYHGLYNLLENGQRNCTILSDPSSDSNLTFTSTTNSNTILYHTTPHHTIASSPPPFSLLHLISLLLVPSSSSPRHLPETRQGHCCYHPDFRQDSNLAHPTHSNIPFQQHEHDVPVPSHQIPAMRV